MNELMNCQNMTFTLTRTLWDEVKTYSLKNFMPNITENVFSGVKFFILV